MEEEEEAEILMFVKNRVYENKKKSYMFVWNKHLTKI